MNRIRNKRVNLFRKKKKLERNESYKSNVFLIFVFYSQACRKSLPQDEIEREREPSTNLIDWITCANWGVQEMVAVVKKLINFLNKMWCLEAHGRWTQNSWRYGLNWVSIYCLCSIQPLFCYFNLILLLFFFLTSDEVSRKKWQFSFRFFCWHLF